MNKQLDMKKNFFIINSDNLEDTETRLYGYIINDNQVITSDNPKNLEECNGSYIYVLRENDNITIYQDYLGSYGLYLFKKENFFAVSNSFIKLEEFIKEKFEISLNDEYAKSFISSNIISLSFDETLINEINIIPKNHLVKINLTTKKLSVEKEENSFNSVDLFSEDALSLLDNWFEYWIDSIQNLKRKTNSIFFNLTDDNNSLILLSLLLSSNIDLKKIRVNNKISGDKVSLFQEILNQYNINQNSDIVLDEKIYEDMEISLEKSFNVKLGFNKQINYNNFQYKNIIYSINDTNIESLKQFDNLSQYLYNRDILIDNKFSQEFTEVNEKFLEKNVQKIQKYSKNYDINSLEFTKIFTNETALRNFVGKNNVESFLRNNITLNPLLDYELQKIKVYSDKENYTQLLSYVIVKRYCPELIEYLKFNEKEQKLMDYATEINQKLKYNPKKRRLISGPKLNKKTKQNTLKSDELKNFITKIFFTNTFKHSFLKYYPKQVYDTIIKEYYHKNQYTTNDIMGSINVLKILSDIEYNHSKFFKSESDWLKSFVTTDNLDKEIKVPTQYMLDMYSTARIDFKNREKYTNQVKILKYDDENLKVSTPDWFSDDKGVGICVSSNKSELSLKIKCINDGDLRIDLRTLDVKDRTGTRFPIYIDYLSFKIDEKEYLKENTLVTHDKPKIITRKVFDNEIINIEAKWQPFTRLSKYNK